MVIYSRIIFLIVLCFGQHKISLHSLPNGKQRLAAQKCEKTVARGISLGLNHCQSQRTNWGVYIISTRRERTFQPDATVNTHTHNCPEYRQQTCKYFLTHYLNKSTEIERQTIDSLFQEHAPPVQPWDADTSALFKRPTLLPAGSSAGFISCKQETMNITSLWTLTLKKELKFLVC